MTVFVPPTVSVCVVVDVVDPVQAEVTVVTVFPFGGSGTEGQMAQLPGLAEFGGAGA